MCEAEASSSALFFPPFPPRPRGLVSFSDYQVQGVKKTSRVLPAAPPQPQEIKTTRPTKGGVRLAAKDCWSIGAEDVLWEEPIGTSLADYDVSIPPFTRLLAATRDFINSRHDGFDEGSARRLFDILRNILGLRSDFPGAHWSGQGPNAQDYVPTRAAKYQNASEATLEDEVCPLLKSTVASVRGVLALARQETEATWQSEAAQLFAEITAAFLAFIEHYEVLPEKQDDVRAALALARPARRQLIEAKHLEDSLEEGFNALCCAAAVEGSPAHSKDTNWPVNSITAASTKIPSEARQLLASQHHIRVEPASIVHHIPYARRRVVRACKATPPFSSTPMLQVTTAAAPWTIEEKWRAPQTVRTVLAESPVHAAEITIFVEDSGLSPTAVIGMGLRGEWYRLQLDACEIWAFRGKDVVLPAFWQSAAATDAE